MYELNSPPTIKFPLGSKAIVNTSPSKPVPVLKEVSMLPLEFSLIIRFAVTSLYFVNSPPKNIFPSGCKRITLIFPSNPVPVLKVTSLVPSGFKRII